ncbi:GNAT family N-acetyltransferase [Psychroserpens sp.]
MNSLIVKTINPLKNLIRVKELLLQLNPEKEGKYFELKLEQMHRFKNFKCFGLYENNKIIGISSGWTTVRIYCGKQLELDNVIIDEQLQSKGLGKIFIDKIEDWALQKDYKSLSLNTYVSNSRSHKFYFNQGFDILGFHFQKLIK